MTPDTTIAQLLAATIQQNDLLKQLMIALDPPKLGPLAELPGQKLYVYCNRSHGWLWYVLDADRQPQEFPAKAIRGYLRGLEFDKTERRGKESIKLVVTLECDDRAYRLESGYDSTFAKGILTGVAAMSPDILLQPVAIAPQAGKDESVLLARVYDHTNSPVFAGWDESTDWRKVATTAITNVKQANFERS